MDVVSGPYLKELWIANNVAWISWVWRLTYYMYSAAQIKLSFKWFYCSTRSAQFCWINWLKVNKCLYSPARTKKNCKWLRGPWPYKASLGVNTGCIKTTDSTLFVYLFNQITVNCLVAYIEQIFFVLSVTTFPDKNCKLW